MRFKKRFSKDKKEISLIWIVVWGVFGIGAYMGAFEGKLFENGWEIVKDLGNNWNLLGIVMRTPGKKEEVNMDKWSIFSDSKKKMLGELNYEGIKHAGEGGGESLIWKSDFGLDETGIKFTTPTFEPILKATIGNGKKLKVEEGQERAIGRLVRRINYSEEAKKLEKQLEKIKQVCLNKNFEGEKLIESWLVKKEEEIKKRRNRFCTSRKNHVTEYIRNKLINERKTSAVFNWLEQAKIIFAGDHIYIKFNNLWIFLGKEYYRKDKKGWKLSLNILKNLRLEDEQTLRKNWEEMKKINVEKTRKWNEMKVIKGKLSGKIFNMINEYDVELDGYKRSLEKIADKIGVQKHKLDGIDSKLKRYKAEFVRKWNEKIDVSENDRVFIWERIDLNNEKYLLINETELASGGLFKDKWHVMVNKKEKQLNDMRMQIEKKIIEKLSLYESIETLRKILKKDGKWVQDEILKLENIGKKYEEIGINKENLEEKIALWWETFLKIVAILTDGSEKGKYEKNGDFEIKGDLTEFDSVKNPNDFLKKSEGKWDDGYWTPIGELRHQKFKKEFEGVGKERRVDKIYEKQTQNDSGDYKMVLDIFVKGKNTNNFGEITFHKMIQQYNKVSQWNEQQEKNNNMNKKQAKWAIAKKYVEKNDLISELLVPDYNQKQSGQKMSFAKNKQMQMTDPWDVWQRIENEIDEMVSRQIFIKSLDYGRNLTEDEEKKLKSEYQIPSRYAYVLKKGSKVDIPEGYCKVVTVEDWRNRLGYLPFGWACVKNSQIMIFD